MFPIGITALSIYFTLKSTTPHPTHRRVHMPSLLPNSIFSSSAAQPLGILVFKIRNCYLTVPFAKNSKDDTSISYLYSDLLFTIQGRKRTQTSHPRLYPRSIICTLRCTAWCHSFYNLQIRAVIRIHPHTTVWPPTIFLLS